MRFSSLSCRRRTADLCSTDPLALLSALYAVIQQFDNDSLPPRCLSLSLLLSRKSFRQTTLALPKSDPLIPADFTKAYTNTVSLTLSSTNPLLAFHAAQLFEQIAVYVIATSSDLSVIQTLSSNMSDPALTIPCAIALSYVFQERELPQSVQTAVLEPAIGVLSSTDIQGQPFRAGLITKLILSFSFFLAETDDCSNLANSMLEITAFPDLELKLTCYDFWSRLALSAQQLFAFVPAFFDVCVADLQIRNERLPKQIHTSGLISAIISSTSVTIRMGFCAPHCRIFIRFCWRMPF
jgi:hypothetical protein